MPNLLARILRRSDEVVRYTPTDYLRWLQSGRWGLVQPWGSSPVSYAKGKPAERIENSYTGYTYGAYKANPIVFAVMTKRQSIFSEARFMWRRTADGRPGELFHDAGLDLLARPWPNCTTGELLSRMLQDVDLGGNFYATRDGDRLRRLRPDWVQIVLSGDPRLDRDVDVIGYVYTPGGPDAGEAVGYLPDQICHWSPIPDPDALYRGMSWLTPVIREIQGDQAAMDHKLNFFANGATLGPIIRVPAGMTAAQFKQFVDAATAAHQGVENAYKPMFIGGGADVTLQSATMQQLDFKGLQGASETRICVAGQVPAVIVGVSEGLSGSSLNSGNYQSAKRSFVDGTLRPLWRSACAALATILDVPGDAELWYDERDIAFLREDQQDLAQIQQTQASTLNTLITAGFEPASAVAALIADDLEELHHTGLTSVQLMAPGSQDTDGDGVADTIAPDAAAPDAAAGEDYAAALRGGPLIERRAPHRYRHGWIPIAPTSTTKELDRDYGDELDRAEFSGGACLVARSEGMVTVETGAGDGKYRVHATGGPAEARAWADHIDENRAAAEPVTDGELTVHRDADSGDTVLRWSADEDDQLDGVELPPDEVDDYVNALRDLAYITEDNQNVPDDDDEDLDDSEPEDDDPVERRAPYPGQRYTHGWVPVAGGGAASVLSPPTGQFRILADPGERGDYHPVPGVFGAFGAAGVVIRAPGRDGQPRYLLVQRGHNYSNPGKWQLPGGALQSKEDAYQGAARELVEETGASPRYAESMTPLGETVFTHSSGWQYTTIAAVARKPFAPEVDGGETADAQWFTDAEIRLMAADGKLHPQLAPTIGPILDSYPAQATRSGALGYGDIVRKYNPGQARNLAGHVGAGQWTSIETRVLAALYAWRQSPQPRSSDPLGAAGFTQPQLKTAATRLGLNPPKGMKLVPLKSLLMSHGKRQHKTGVPLPTTGQPKTATPAAPLAPGAVNPPAPPTPPTPAASPAPAAPTRRAVQKAIDAALANWAAGNGDNDPLPAATFSRDDVRKAAQIRLLTLVRNESRDSIVAKLLAHQRGQHVAARTATQAVEAGDFSALVRIGPQGGSNPGGIFQAPDGSQWYVKEATSEQWAREQSLAAELYTLAGIATPAIHVGKGTQGLNNGYHTATRIIPGTTAPPMTSPPFIRQAQEGFAVDAWLADWDVGQSGNLVAVGAAPIRMDIGGSLRFRARGGPKGAAFGATVGEWTTMRDPQNISGPFFKTMTPTQLADSVDKVLAVSEDDIRAAVKKHGQDKALADLLIARRKDLEAKQKAIRVKTAAAVDHIAIDDGASLAAIVQQAQNGVVPPSKDSLLRIIADQQGFSAPPAKVTTTAAVGKLGTAGTHHVVYRGVYGGGGRYGNFGGTSNKTAQQMQDDFRTGEAYYGTGIYGNGIYSSTIRGTAAAYSDRSAGSVVRFAIPKSAKIVTYTQIDAEWRKWLSKFPTGDPRHTVYADVARYAAARGYDAIEVPQGARRQGHRPDVYYVILNRSILTVAK